MAQLTDIQVESITATVLNIIILEVARILAYNCHLSKTCKESYIESFPTFRLKFPYPKLPPIILGLRNYVMVKISPTPDDYSHEPGSR